MLDAGTVPKTDENKKSITSAALRVENKNPAPEALSALRKVVLIWNWMC